MVEPLSITWLSSSFTDCESASSVSDFVDTCLVTSSKEGGVTDFNNSIDCLVYIAVAATDSNSDCNAAPNVASISTSEKSGVTNSVLSITVSTSVSVLK